MKELKNATLCIYKHHTLHSGMYFLLNEHIIVCICYFSVMVPIQHTIMQNTVVYGFHVNWSYYCYNAITYVTKSKKTNANKSGDLIH